MGDDVKKAEVIERRKREKTGPDWKKFANYWKIFVAIEIAFLYVLGPFFDHPFPFFDLVGIGLFQYAIFSPVDASILIDKIKGLKG